MSTMSVLGEEERGMLIDPDFLTGGVADGDTVCDCRCNDVVECKARAQSFVDELTTRCLKFPPEEGSLFRMVAIKLLDFAGEQGCCSCCCWCFI